MPLSPAQQTWNNYFKAAAARWNANLTEAQRQAWRSFASQFPRRGTLGQTYTPTAQNRHAGCNAISFAYGATWVNDPPPDQDVHQPQQLDILTCSHSPQELTIYLNSTLGPNEVWVIHGTPQQNPGFNNPARLFRLITVGAYALPYTLDITAGYTAIFGALNATNKLWIMLRIADTSKGVISQPLTAHAFVTD